MSDVTIIPGQPPYSQSLIAGSNINLGSVVACFGTAATVNAAIGSAAYGAHPPLGLAVAPAAVGGEATYQFVGVLELSIAQWTSIIDEGGELAAGVTYYESPTTPGNITAIRPSAGGQYVTPVGSGLSPIKFQINPGLPVQIPEG